MIWFNVQEARDFLLERGEVYTLRPKRRREGVDVLAYGGFGSKGKVCIDLIRIVKSKAELELYAPKSGFAGVEDWISKAEELYGMAGEEWLAAGRPLYRVVKLSEV